MTTLNLQVGASADDAFQIADDTVSIIAIDALCDSTTEHVGNRWTSVTIPNGATIDQAIFSIFVSGSLFDEPQHQVRAEAADNAAAFTTGSNNIDARTRTTATVQWNSTNLGVVSEGFEQWGCTTTGGAGTDIKAVIQEIIDRAGWVSGNALVLIYEQHTLSGTRDLNANMWDNNTAQAAKLDIDYTAGGTGALVLQSIAGVASLTNVEVGTPRVTLQSVAGLSSLTNVNVATPANLAVQSVAGVASLPNLEVATPAIITFQGVAGIAAVTNVEVSVPAVVVPGAVAGLASLTNVEVGTPKLNFDAVAGVASLTNVEVGTPLLNLAAIAGVAALPNVELASPGPIVLQAVAGIASLPNVTIDAEAQTPESGGLLLKLQ